MSEDRDFTTFPPGYFLSDTESVRIETVSDMTLRDYFAAKAMPAVYRVCIENGAVATGPDWRVGIALDCYAMADALLAARSEGK